MKVSTRSNTEFTPHPPTDGPIRAVIVDITDPQLKEAPPYGPKWRCAVVFETEALQEDGTNFTIWKHGLTVRREEDGTFALIMGGKKKSKFEELLDELEVKVDDAFDTEQLIGLPVRLIVDHKRDSKDATKTYANVTYLRRDKTADPMQPSGDYVRKKDRTENSSGQSTGGSTRGGAQYNPVPGSAAPADDAWMHVKVHVGQFAGTSVMDLPDEAAVDNLLSHWWPTVKKPLVADSRLHAALLRAKQEFEKMRQDTKDTGPNF